MKGTPTRSGINLGWYEQKYHLKFYFLKIVRYHELQFNDSELIEPLFIHELKKHFYMSLVVYVAIAIYRCISFKFHFNQNQ